MDYEKKYKEALERATKAKNNASLSNGTLRVLGIIFPELKESEDERIANAIKKHLDMEKSERNLTGYFGVSYQEAAAWLEKQGEQKSADKVVPKFNAGDWVTHNTANFVFKIINVGSNGYEVVNRENYKKTISFDNQDNYHLWTIQDAKDGDVLAFSDDTIVIFKDLYNSSSFHSYCHIEDGEFGISEDDMPDWWKGKGFLPATKEQRELLYSKMKDAGYEWDSAKKELRKIKNTKEEVDLGKEKDDYWNKLCDSKFVELVEIDAKLFDDIAKHFYELGLKAQKGG